MAGYGIAIRMADADTPGVPPDGVTFTHHLTDRAQVSAESLSGGYLLHLAVAGCLFNDILREARHRGIAITKLEVSADGGFVGDQLVSTGITYSVDLAADAPDDELRQLVAECEQVAAIPQVLRHGNARPQARLRPAHRSGPVPRRLGRHRVLDDPRR
jgi:uncharacterized OsmC-like protein